MSIELTESEHSEQNDLDAAEKEKAEMERQIKEQSATERYEQRNQQRRELKQKTMEEENALALIGQEFNDRLETKLLNYAYGSKTRGGQVIIEDSDEE